MSLSNVPPAFNPVPVGERKPLPTTLLVAGNVHHAEHIVHQLGGCWKSRVCGDIRVVWPGICLAGFPANLIIVTEHAGQKRLFEPRFDDWFDSILPMRLRPGGKIVNL